MVGRNSSAPATSYLLPVDALTSFRLFRQTLAHPLTFTLTLFLLVPVMNVYTVSTMYIMGLNINGGDNGGDIFHCELCR